MDEITSAQSADLSNQVSIAMARKAMDSEKEQGDAMVDLIRQAAQTQPRPVDGHIDLYA